MTTGKYRHRYTPTASDITPQYRLTPNAMLMYFQDSFARLMTIHHVAAFDIVKQQRMWVITEFHIDVKPTVTFWSEDFVVELWISELSTLRIYCDFRIVRADNEELIASGTSQWNILSSESHSSSLEDGRVAKNVGKANILNLETKRLESTDFLKDTLTVVPELMTESHKKVRFPKSQSVNMQLEHRVSRLDLDFNYHVNNRCYVSIALLTMPDDVLATHTLTSLTVHWLHETYLDDTLTCKMSQADEETYLHVLTNSEGTAVCELMSHWQPQGEVPEVSEVLNRKL